MGAGDESGDAVMAGLFLDSEGRETEIAVGRMGPGLFVCGGRLAGVERAGSLYGSAIGDRDGREVGRSGPIGLK